MSDFIQNDQKEDATATEKTEVWIFYDRDNVYVVARCWETHPERMIANEMRHDSLSLFQNDLFGFSFDTSLRIRSLYEANQGKARLPTAPGHTQP